MKKHASIFISDIHLNAKEPAKTSCFFAFLDNIASTYENLFILGDFFEFWVGDDYIDEFAQTIITKLKELHASGTKIYLVPGNRDFLFGQKFADLTNITLLEDPSIVELYEKLFYLTHGDKLCANNLIYWGFHKLSRNNLLQKLLLKTPIRFRLKLAKSLRNRSKNASYHNDRGLTSSCLNDKHIAKLFQKYKISYIIHGHIHHHEEQKYNDSTYRYCLGEWKNHTGHYLIVSPDEIITRQFGC